MSAKSRNGNASATHRMANLNFHVNVELVYPLTNGECTSISIEDALSGLPNHPSLREALLERHLTKTWQIRNASICTAKGYLIKRLKGDDETRRKVPLTGPVVKGFRFPYLWSEVHWKYNMQQYMAEWHPNWEEILANNNSIKGLLNISIEELEGLGIPMEYHGHTLMASWERGMRGHTRTSSIRDIQTELPRRPPRNPDFVNSISRPVIPQL
ncbi:hypothetical protein FA15DRAFT_710762 [Coprinopsis marcescibilis]|uniref:SAM domain-containing protein n=1 Tax=Coprinopsis marcescibilis TaxID=230819 RepID=A0A5C3KCJ1_COPMA|nr:hypothetical protein FA15DRAFT_710762 [Coprinopsis marcescibilis]